MIKQKKLVESKKRRSRGQGLVEYMILVAVIAVVCIPVVTRYGGVLVNQFAAITLELAGQSGAANVQAAQLEAAKAQADAAASRGLATYTSK